MAGLTRTQYYLICLIEEAAEVVQRACKALRFGLWEVQDGQKLTNKERLQQEWIDLVSVANEIELRRPNDLEAAEKREKVERYRAYSRAIGEAE